jgi:hypothetical protein
MYPNPATDVLNISAMEQIESVSIINVMGATLRTVTNIRSAEYAMPLEGIEAGVYFVKVRSADNTMQISRLVKR